MTTQAIFTAQSIGATTNTGEGKFSIAPLTIGATTTAYVVSIKITLGADEPLSKTKKIRVWYTTTTHTVAAADAVSQLGQTARFVEVTADRPIIIADSTLEPVTGSKFHAWADPGTLTTAGSLTGTLVELP